MSEIGQRVKARREELGLTQEELARLLGYKGKSSIHKIEVGFADVPRAKAGAFARALNMPLWKLMGEAPDIPDPKAITFSYCLEKQMECLDWNTIADSEGNVILVHAGAMYEITQEDIDELEKRVKLYLKLILNDLAENARKIGG